jgi:hypothetical protein
MRAYGDEIRIVKSERRRYLRFAMSAAPPPLPPPPTR